MPARRYLAGGLLFLSAFAAMLAPAAAVAALAIIFFALRPLALGRRAALLSVVPVASFAAVLAAIELVSRGSISSLPLRTIAVYLAVTIAARVWPWEHALGAVSPGSILWTPVLFALVSRHFVAILASETVRGMRAWSLAVPRRFGPGAFASLVAVLHSIALRCWIRAERFYAAQRLRGLAS